MKYLKVFEYHNNGYEKLNQPCIDLIDKISIEDIISIINLFLSFFGKRINKSLSKK
jgi:hypothetical protein